MSGQLCMCICECVCACVCEWTLVCMCSYACMSSWQHLFCDHSHSFAQAKLIAGTVMYMNPVHAHCMSPELHEAREASYLFRYLCCCTLLAVSIMSQQQTVVSQGQISSDNYMCCQTGMEVADQICYFIQSQYTDTRPVSCSTDAVTPGRVAT